MQKSHTITASIAYPNAVPHLGYALELVQVDFFARYARQFLDADVWLQIGTDEHGKKMHRTALERGVPVLEYATQMQEQFRILADELQVDYSRFIRTTDQDHAKVAQWLWKQVAQRGYLEKRRYQAWYDIKEETFLGSVTANPDPSVFGVDPKHIEQVDETNWFFTFSAFRDQLMALLTSDQYEILPRERRNEMVQFLERGLDDVSVSRDASVMPWGIPVPGDENQVMYVWFDALTNYLTGVSKCDDNGELTVSSHWPPQMHVVGKDIARFHALLWPAMLLAAGFTEAELPKRLLVHGHILAADGTKMSKSIGNVIDPIAELEAVGVTALRWFLLRDVPTMGDVSASRERIVHAYQRDLANGYGNLVSRVFAMVQKYRGGVVLGCDVAEAGQYEREVVAAAEKGYHAAIAECRVDLALNAAFQAVAAADERIESMAPWKLAKDESKADELDELLYELVELLWHIGRLLEPVIPSLQMATLFPGVTADDLQAPTWGRVPVGMVLPELRPLFPRIEL
jgi:methionyl-tRNA synthetase